MLTPMDGWDGPHCLAEGIFRYSKCFSWIRLSIQVEESEFCGGIYGTASDFELFREGDCWMRNPTRPAWTASGEPKMVLRGCSTWDAVYERTAEGVAAQEMLESIEDMAAFLEKCIG